MATAANVPLLDLSFLTAEERARVEAVVRADQSMLLQDRVRVGTLRQELQQHRYAQKRLLGKPQCTCCGQRLGRFFNSGAPCPNCLYRVCKTCRVTSHKPPPPFLCPVCTKKRLLDIQAANYTLLPSPDFSPSPMFGSQLIMMSLEASGTREQSSMHNPYDGRAKRSLLSHLSQTDLKPRSGTAESAIVVRYSDSVGGARSESVLSGRSDNGTASENGHRERPSSLPAAKKVPRSDYSDSGEEEEEGDEEHGNVLEVPGLSRMRHSESVSSIGSLTSMYSAAGGRGEYAVSGEVQFGVWYSQEGLLLVHVNQARNLAAARKEGYSYPYVKIYMLPDRSKHTKRKTGFVRRTVSPKYDETFKYKLTESELSSRTLWLSVWDWDRFGRNQFLGEVRLPLSSLDLTDSTDHWYTLVDQDDSAQEESDSQYRGRLRLGLMLELDPDLPPPPPPPPSSSSSSHGKPRKPPRRKAVLHVSIKHAEDLPKMDSTASTNAVVKCYLLPSRTSSNKRKTRVVMNSVAPSWNEEFIYKCSHKELVGDRVLEVTIWDYDKRGSNDFIGGLHIGPSQDETSRNREWMDSIGEEVSHWETVLAQPGEWVERWHTLRPRMDCSVVKLPEKPKTPLSFSRELSPVPETPNPPLEEREGEGEGEKVERGEREASPSKQACPRDTDSTSTARKRPESPLSTTARASSVSSSSKEVGGRSNGITNRKPSPLTQTKFIHDDLSGKKEVSQGGVQTHSPSPVPQLLVTSEAAGIPHSHSTGSLHSTHSDSETILRGDYQIAGEIQIRLLYRGGRLMIHVNRARGLAAGDSSGYSDPYVKTYLLPDHSKHSKRKTSVKKKTLDPVFNEILEYSVTESELSSKTLWLSVWDWDRFGRNQFLGEMKVPLQSLDLWTETDVWYPLVDKDQPYHLNPSSPQMQLALRFCPRETEGGVTRVTLSVEIRCARNISGTKEPTNSPPRSFASCVLLPDTSSKRRTAVVEGSSFPVWKESFSFERVTLEEIARERVLEVRVMNADGGGGSGGFIGGLRIGPSPDGMSRNREWMDSIGEEVSHWETVLAHPGEWVERWHTLRTTMATHGDVFTGQSVVLEDEFRKTSPKRDKNRQTAPQDNTVISGATALEEEFIKSVPPKREEFSKTFQRSSPHESPLLSKKAMQLPSSSTSLSSSKLVENRFTPMESGSNSRSVSPLTLGEISRSKDRLYSRSTSPETVTTPDTTPHGTLERPANQKPPSGPLKRAGLLGVKHAGSHSSFGSQLSVYSAAGEGKGDYEITGEVMVGISYDGGQLKIHVNRAQALAAANSNGYSDPYVKTYLLPDHSKHSKRKTSVNKRTVNPLYDQTLIYKLTESELSSRTLWLSVWDWDRFGRNQFLGEVRLPLSSLDLTDSTDHWYTLMDKDDDSSATDFYRGQLQLALRYSPSGTKKGKTRGSLQIVVKQGREFPGVGGNEKPDPVVKCYLLPDKSSAGKRKVGIIKNRSDPVWEEMVAYDKVVLEEVATERVLEVTVWDWDKKGSSFIGGLRIGPSPDGTSRNREWMDSIGEEVSHWEMVLAHPGEWVERWHTLRTTMDYRNIGIQ